MSFSPSDNSKILNATIDFVLLTRRFDEQLYKIMKVVSTDHKQANNLTSLIICFLSNGHISFVYVKINIFF